jgi:hypothetical protein
VTETHKPGRNYAPLLSVHPAKDPATAYADARAGRVPGAFRLKPRGRWYVDLDVWDAHLEELRRVRSPERAGRRCPTAGCAVVEHSPDAPVCGNCDEPHPDN